jgi:hypothetical protein
MVLQIYGLGIQATRPFVVALSPRPKISHVPLRIDTEARIPSAFRSVANSPTLFSTNQTLRIYERQSKMGTNNPWMLIFLHRNNRQPGTSDTQDGTLHGSTLPTSLLHTTETASRC